MAVLSVFQIAALAKEAGFPANQIAIAVAIASAESGNSTDAIGPPNHDGSRDYGLWQINNKAHADLLSRYQWSNPHDNAKMAFIIWTQAGNSWRPWSTFNSGAYQKNLDLGQVGSEQPSLNGVPGGATSGTGTGAAPTTGASFFANASKASDGGLGWFTRIVLFFVGIAILFRVMGSILNRSDTVQTVTKVAKFAAKVPK